MRIFAMVVSKNEAHRYWGAFLEWTQTFADEVVVYDDRSTDATVEIAIQKGCLTAVRFEDEPSFMDHEGRFRQAAWRWLEVSADPAPGDWIICLDADEFLVDSRGERQALEDCAEGVSALGGNAIALEIPEIFEDTPTGLYRRVDGWWGSISGVRFVAWEPGGVFVDKPMACGSVPTYARTVGGPGPFILHLGYADPRDRQEKFERYSQALGHSSSHVRSIWEPGRLELWEGPLPFGTRTPPERQ